MAIKFDCFGCKKGRCQVLTVSKCEGESCSFYKTKLDYKIDRENAMKRILSLPEKVKRNIIDKYYEGE